MNFDKLLHWLNDCLSLSFDFPTLPVLTILRNSMSERIETHLVEKVSESGVTCES